MFSFYIYIETNTFKIRTHIQVLVTNVHFLLVEIISYHWTVGSFPKPWTCIDHSAVIVKGGCYMCLCEKTPVTPPISTGIFTHVSQICLFMYQICGLDIFEKQNWFYYKSLTSLITPELVPRIFNQIIVIPAPVSGLPRILSPTGIFPECIFSPTDLYEDFWQAWWKGI